MEQVTIKNWMPVFSGAVYGEAQVSPVPQWENITSVDIVDNLREEAKKYKRPYYYLWYKGRRIRAMFPHLDQVDNDVTLFLNFSFFAKQYVYYPEELDALLS